MKDIVVHMFAPFLARNVVQGFDILSIHAQNMVWEVGGPV